MSVKIKKINIKNNMCRAIVDVNGNKDEVWYEFPFDIDKNKINAANALLVAFLPIAMKTSDKIIIEGNISKKLLDSLKTYQEIMKKWYPELNIVKIEFDRLCDDIKTDESKKRISCFTGGVDAFYTLIKNEKKIDELLFVWGFDIPLTNDVFYHKVEKHLKKVASEMKKNIVFVKTNLGFEITNKYASWGDYCYGAAIASVILFMSNKYFECLVPSCNDYSVLTPRGSHILINHLWNCDNVSFIYDGAESSRTEKVDLIADSKVVQKNLRVCYSSNDEYNCSECEKCLRTMASLYALGKINKIKTFKPLSLSKIGETKLENESQLNFAKATLKKAIENNKLDLVEELKKQINNYEIEKIAKKIDENFDIFIINESFESIRDRILLWNVNNNTKKTFKLSTKKIIKKIFNGGKNEN